MQGSFPINIFTVVILDSNCNCMIFWGVFARTFFQLSWNLLIWPIKIILIQINRSLSIKLSQIVLIVLQSANVSLSTWLKMASLRCGNLKNWSSILYCWHCFLTLLLNPYLCFEGSAPSWKGFRFFHMSLNFKLWNENSKYCLAPF
mgnify:CR=1 FL=1